LYVSPGGDDVNDGLSPAESFRTISRSAEVVEPGDLVLVSGGTYAENVYLTRAGTAEHPIVFRAMPNETVVMTQEARPEQWERVQGTRSVYSTPYSPSPYYVWEDRTISEYAPVQDRRILRRLPGSFFYDAASKRLLVHPMKGLEPETAGIVIIGFIEYPGHGKPPKDPSRGYEYAKGFSLMAPYNRVEGFTICYKAIAVQFRTEYCEARNCTWYGCLWGTRTRAYKGNRCVIAGNTGFGNAHSGIHVHHADGTTIQDNYCWGSGPSGPFRASVGPGYPFQVAAYGKIGDITLLRNKIVSSNPRELIRFKTAHKKVICSRNVFVGGQAKLGWGTGAEYSNNTAVRARVRVRRNGPFTPENAKKYNSVIRDNLTHTRRGAVRLEDGFADPARHDYRLRRDSPHLGTGAFPDAASLRYVSTNGHDNADGATPATAWRTLGKAAEACVPGETIYVLPGTYPESITIAKQGTAESPIAVKTYGRGRVVIDGEDKMNTGVVLENAAHVEIEGFILKGFTQTCFQVRGGTNIKLVDNVLDGSQTGLVVDRATEMLVANNTITGARKGINARSVARALVLRNNLFVDAGETPVGLDDKSASAVISERNCFSAPCGETWLGTWQKRVYEPHPSFAVPVQLSSPDYLLPMFSTLAFRGLGHKPLGARGAPPDTSPVEIADFRVACLRPTQAVLTWQTPRDFVNAVVAWTCPEIKASPEKKTITWKPPSGLPLATVMWTSDGRTGEASIGQDYHLKSTSLAARLPGLMPGKTYNVKLLLTDTRSMRSGTAEMAFKTPVSSRGPATLYVAPAGDDANSGLDRSSPVRTLNAASLAAVPGDTILVAPGVYCEMLTIWCGGISPDQRLTWRSEKPGAAVIDGAEILSSAIRLDRVSHVTIDGFRFKGLLYNPSRTTVLLSHVEDLILMNSIFGDESCSNRHVQLLKSSNIVIRNNLFHYPFDAIRGVNCQDVTIDHNTFPIGACFAVSLCGANSKLWRVTNNIFVDVVGDHTNSATAFVGDPGGFDISKNLVCDYNLYWQKKWDTMRIVGQRGSHAVTLDEAQKMFGFGAHSKYVDPMFADPGKGDFTLKAGSPAIGMGEDGTNVGMTPPPEVKL